MRTLPMAAVGLLALAGAVASALAPPVAADPIAHRIVREEASNFGRTVDIAVERPIGEAQMAAIVRDLALKTPGKGRRTFVNFYLPGMKAGEAPWASATHAGDIAVVVEGGAVEGDEGEASASPGALPPDALVGAGDATATFAVAWPAPGERIVIERRAGRLTATTIGADGGRRVEELAEAASLRGRRLDVLKSGSGGFYILRPDGSLEVHGRAGLAAKAGIAADEPARASSPGDNPAGRRNVVEAPRTPLTATGISIIEPWPQTGQGTLAVARSVLAELPAKPVLVKAHDAATAAGSRPASTSAAVRRADGGASPGATKGSSADAASGGSDQTKLWRSLARYLDPKD